jgi:hypothetical protein
MLLERKTRTSKQGSYSFGGGELQEAAGRWPCVVAPCCQQQRGRLDNDPVTLPAFARVAEALME